MESTATGPKHAEADPSRTNLALGLAAATVLVMVILSIAGADGAVWILQGALAAATVVVAVQAGGRSTSNPRAFGALVVGGVLFLVFLGFAIAEAL